MHKIFIDSDVILDAFIERVPFKENALKLITLIERNEVKGFTSPLVFANIYYIIAKIRNKNYALDKIKFLKNIIKILPIDEEIVGKAIEHPFKDFEDSIQYHCSQKNNIKTIITRNKRDFPMGLIKIIDPWEYLEIYKKGT